MTFIKGVYGAVDDAAAAWRNSIEDIRAMVWNAWGRSQGIVTGFVMTPTVGSLAVDFTAGGAIIEQRGTDINGDGRGYFVYNDVTTTVTFSAPSAASRNDAVVFCWGDPQYGALGASAASPGGPQIVVVQGVSGSTTPRTDTQIQTAIGVGGWFRFADVIIAPGNTTVQAGNITDNHPSVQSRPGPKRTQLTSSANFTRADRPAAVGARVRVWGAGGGGGAADGDGGGSGESSGGGSGEYREKYYDAASWAALARTIAVTVGTGGAGGIAGTGGNGGSTTFDTVTAAGGSGGLTGANTTTSNTISGGAGGTGGSGGDVTLTGNDGGNGVIRSNIPTFVNFGAPAPGDGGGGMTRYPPPFATGNGATGKTPGGGGSGCYANAAVDRVGGAGAPGRVVITEYF